MNTKRNYPGSRWWKMDFHTHTPQSDDYGRGNAAVKANTTPDKWLQRAMSAGLDAVVVADHNTGGWIDQLKSRYAELNGAETKPDWFRPLSLFPGVEITVSNGNSRSHLLAVFDADSADGNTITSVLGSCGITRGFGDDKNTSTTTSFEETVDRIEKAGGIAIPAHIDADKGLLHDIFSLNPELKKSLREVFAAEFCDPNAFDNADAGLKKEIGRLAVLAGSDAHQPDEIGRYFSWIKMSRPSMEGLTLALMDHEYCIKNQEENPNYVPDIYLTSLFIKGMRHCGRIPGHPFEMTLHPHFNAVIGGRGTGKSTTLESIRIAARREKELEETPKLKDELDKFMGQSSNKGVMLNNTELAIGIHRRGKDYWLKWRFDGSGDVLLEKDGEWRPCEPGDLVKRFPINIYSQKQINELASNPKGLLELLDRSMKVNRAEWQQRWNTMKSRFLQLSEHQREISRQLSQEPQIRSNLIDVENDLKQYEKKGHGEILKNYQKRSQELRSMPLEESFENLSENIRTIADKAEILDFPVHIFSEDDPAMLEVQTIHNETGASLLKIQEELLEIAHKVERLSVERKKKLEASQWYQSVQETIQAYKALIREYDKKHSPIDLNVYGQWVRQRGQLQQKIVKMNLLRKESDNVTKQIDQTYQELQELRTELMERRKAFISSVIGENIYVRMELVPFGDTSTIESEYRTLLGLDDNAFRSSLLDQDRRQGLLWDLFGWEKAETEETDIPSLIDRLKRMTKNLAAGNTSGAPGYIHGAFTKRLQRSHEQQPANLDLLWCWWPEDLLRVKYVRDPQKQKFEDLEKGSAGQKAAAILAFLLSYGTEPLIIDQPEDDLDNALIYDLVVRQIHENKNRRQLVIVTHNPNIVVNGDAELVHVLKFEGGQVLISDQGGLEEGVIRKRICNIMEGGREAFEKRYKRITLEVK